MNEDETTEDEDNETCSSFGLEPTNRKVQKETEPTQVTEAAVNQKREKKRTPKNLLSLCQWKQEPMDKKQ